MPVLRFLEVQFEPKLKLSRVIDRGRLAVITAIAGALVECVHGAEFWIRGRFVETIEEVKSPGNQNQSHVLAKANATHHAEIQRCVTVRNAAVARQVSSRERGRRGE